MKNLSEINTNTIEGRLLIATLSQLSTEPGYSNQHPDDILKKMMEIQEGIYKDRPLPTLSQESDPRFIVAEVSKNWHRNSAEMNLLSERFEVVINVNQARGYKLADWKTHVYINGDIVNETIIAIFEKTN